MENKDKGNRIWISLMAIGCVLVITVPLVFLFLEWSLNSPVVPQQKLEKLHEGMTKEEVRALLGDPTRKTTDDANCETWTYSRRWKWYFLTVRFSPQNELIEHVQDD